MWAFVWVCFCMCGLLHVRAFVCVGFCWCELLSVGALECVRYYLCELLSVRDFLCKGSSLSTCLLMPQNKFRNSNINMEFLRASLPGSFIISFPCRIKNILKYFMQFPESINHSLTYLSRIYLICFIFKEVLYLQYMFSVLVLGGFWKRSVHIHVYDEIKKEHLMFNRLEITKKNHFEISFRSFSDKKIE